MNRRPVRADQHGTITGYVYGCRCEPCRKAKREYGAGRNDRRVGPEAIERIFAALLQEADMDGIVTASAIRLGKVAGLSHTTARFAVEQLVEGGRIRSLGTVAQGIPVLELLEEAS